MNLKLREQTVQVACLTLIFVSFLTFVNFQASPSNQNIGKNLTFYDFSMTQTNFPKFHEFFMPGIQIHPFAWPFHNHVSPEGV